MSWNIEYRYACLELQEVKSQEELNSLLLDFSARIWSKYQQTNEYPECLDQFLWDLENGSQMNEQEIAQSITEIISLYLDQIEFSNKELTLIVRTEYGSEHDDRDFADQLACFLFEKSQNPYFQICSAAFDKAGGYSHQWIGYRKEGNVVIEYSADFMDRLFQQSPSAVLA